MNLVQFTKEKVQYLGVTGVAKMLTYRLKRSIYRDILNRQYMTRPVFDYKMWLDVNDPGISLALCNAGMREL